MHKGLPSSRRFFSSLFFSFCVLRSDRNNAKHCRELTRNFSFHCLVAHRALSSPFFSCSFREILAACYNELSKLAEICMALLRCARSRARSRVHSQQYRRRSILRGGFARERKRKTEYRPCNLHKLGAQEWQNWARRKLIILPRGFSPTPPLL